jgi:MFS family permease
MVAAFAAFGKLPLRLKATQTRGVVAALGTAQTLAWASSYYLPAVLARPMAETISVSPVWIFGLFSFALVVSALIGPWAGRRIDLTGGRDVLMGSNLVFALGLALLALSPSLPVMALGWLLIGLAMGSGLYEGAFAVLAGLYGKGARPSITGITLIAGFASTVGWPLSGLLEAEFGWRWTCAAWAAIHLFVALPLNALLPRRGDEATVLAAPAAATPPTPVAAPTLPPSAAQLILVAFVFAATWFTSTALAAHLPGLLMAAGSSPAAAIAAGALIGPAQVGARLAEYGFLKRFHPLVSARLAASAHPLAAVVLVAFGGPAAQAFVVIHGAGNGVMTIAKGTLPLALFGPAGYGQRQGWLNAPARVLQAFAPLLFGFALERWGVHAIWLTAGLTLAAMLALLVLRAPPDDGVNRPV